jgi:RNA polymerase sigma factor (sigma-70 family)
MLPDTLARTVNRLVADRAVDSDADLLRRFVDARDEAAFTLIVHRHGPMVFGVCRRTLGHQHDAEDAFQAVFLVLARKAHAVHPAGLGRWLYGVAVRVANKARARRARRGPTPSDLNDIPARTAEPPNDWLPLVDTALARMSERDRGPILLCDLLGRSRAEAAAELGVGEGTLSSRLARARARLRTKLTRLGIVPSVLAVTAILSEPVPAALVDITRSAGSAAARELANGVLRSMALTKLSQLAGVGVCLAGAVVGITWIPASGAGPTPAAKETPPPESRKPAVSDAERFKGSWVIESARRNGSENTDPGWIDMAMGFDGEAVKFSRLPGKQKRYKLDAGWDQKRIDFDCILEPAEGGSRRIHIPAIYRFEGDKLHIVLGIVDLDERPESFDPSPKGPPFTHVLLRRSDESAKAPLARPTDTKPAAEKNSRLRELQAERVKTLEEQLRQQFERVKIGKDPLTHYIGAAQELADAEKDLAESNEARIAAVEKLVKSLRDCLDQLKALQQAGLQTQTGVLQGKAALLKAEIELEKLNDAK